MATAPDDTVALHDPSSAAAPCPTPTGAAASSSSSTARPFWREDEPGIVGGQVVRGGMWVDQLRWWRLPNFIRAFVGGYGAGKTMIGGKRTISLALLNAPAPVAYVAPTFALARTTGLVTLEELLEGKRQVTGGALRWSHNQSAHEFRVEYRGRTGRIWYYSGENPKRLKGPNLGAAWIDEPFIQDAEVFKQIVARVRHPRAQRREIDLTGTPEQLNWGYELCSKRSHKYQDVGVVHASTRGNLALDADYINRLRGFFDDKTIEAYVEGRFVNLSTGLVFYAFDPTPAGLHIVDRPMPEGAELGAGMDFNTVPMSAAIFWRSAGHLHFIDEITIPNADTPLIASRIKQKYPALREVFPDASGDNRNTVDLGTTNFTILRRAGFEVRARSKNPWRWDRYSAVNGKLRPATPEPAFPGGPQPPTPPPSLTVSPKCEQLIEYLGQYSHELMLKQKHMSHLCDAFSYPVEYLFPINRDTVRAVKVSGF